MFGKFFKKKPDEKKPENEAGVLKAGDTFFPTGNNLNYKVSRQLSPQLMDKIETSPLQIMATQLYMHYWSKEAENDRPGDPAWENQAIFFWKAEEPFPKKSLPPEFESYDKKCFVIVNNPGGAISLLHGKAIPWFGMPGGGDKLACKRDNEKLSLPSLAKAGVIEYVEITELTENNAAILEDREHYFFLVDERITRFRDNNFYLGEKKVPPGIAYSAGGVHIVRIVK